MDLVTGAVYGVLAGDAELVGLLGTYHGEPAVFTTDPAPGDAPERCIVTAGNLSDAPWDTKTSRGRDIRRDVRCYDAAGGSAVVVEAMAERVRELFHRQPLPLPGYRTLLAECTGPLAADEPDAYGRIVTCHWIMEQTED